MRAWENFVPETLNQRFSRLLLSVHKKTSRLAVLGELGHFPLLVSSLIQTLKYKCSLMCNLCDKISLVYDAMKCQDFLTLGMIVGWPESENLKTSSVFQL